MYLKPTVIPRLSLMSPLTQCILNPQLSPNLDVEKDTAGEHHTARRESPRKAEKEKNDTNQKPFTICDQNGMTSLVVASEN